MGDNSERLPTPGESDNFDPSWAAVLAMLHHMDGVRVDRGVKG